MTVKAFGDIWNRLCDGCSTELLSEMDAADLGLAPDDARTLMRARPTVGTQTAAMAERLGLTQDDLQKEHWRAVDMARACAQCDSANHCARFLAGKKTTFTIEACPNFDLFVELATEDPST